MLGLAADMSVDEFFTRHWQKLQLFAAGSVPDDLPALSGEELAWLATLDDVESRLIFTQRGDQEIPYRLEKRAIPGRICWQTCRPRTGRCWCRMSRSIYPSCRHGLVLLPLCRTGASMT